MDKPKVIVICGPTASGKTALSIELAKKIDGEIISCDSMQIYKDMDIGTAKPSQEEMQGIKHYLIDFVSPDTRYSVADFKKDAKSTIKEIIKKGKTPIIVGGTGLYIDSLIYEIDYQEIQFDETYRKNLEERVKKEGLEDLYSEIEKIFNLNEIANSGETIVSNKRHKFLIKNARENIKKCQDTIKDNMPIDVISSIIREILENLGEITGESVTEDIINEIFSKFCLGK